MTGRAEHHGDVFLLILGIALLILIVALWAGDAPGIDSTDYLP